MTMISQESLVEDLRKMGVRSGDTLFVRAALSKVAKIRSSGNLILGALLQALGPNGTLVSLSYTQSFLFRADTGYIYDQKSASYAGALPNLMLKHPEAKRSSHPTNSVVAIGEHAAFIVRGHDETAPAFEPIRRLLELDSKMLLVGCVDSSPGFTTAHLAEQDLGLSRLVIFPWLNRVYYRDLQGGIQLFKRKDLGLCSDAYRKFYSHYVAHEILTSGFFGDAYSILVPARAAYDIELAILRADPKFNVCGRPACELCNARRWDRLHRLPLFVLQRLMHRFLRARRSS